ncbi:MAG: alanine--glyoxylate aminotransferase family protein [Candidatus Eisenbacteria bacterium]|uniref:Alanine--glyoxylate aminotransferase family protein n=1 Tax=Eiseniibacteriota bacterium TaxID=2212470 RepID=A0A849STK8_UNCEI|nr:alanine--glyoxylate aminotransferase family protein [Candidatus Eisenbacteria bacterium]
MATTPIKVRLFTPGPVEIPARVLRALSQVPPHHRTEGYRTTQRLVIEELRTLHRTRGEVFLFAASGSGAMEAAVVNVMAPGQRALAIGGGKFGERWASILSAFAVAHELLPVEWGQSVDPNRLDAVLAADASLAVVFATHSETSTAALHDLQQIATVVKARGRRLVIDAVTSLGVHALEQDAWGIDVVVCGSQKGLMIPPGIGTVSLSPAAADLIEGDRLPRFYWDLRRARKSAAQGDTSFTPPVSLVLALQEALAMIREEGLEQVWDRHRRVAVAIRDGAKAHGWSLFAAHPAHGVTALVPPAGVNASDVVKRLRDVHGIVVANGQDRLKGQMIRVGHMGHYDLGDAAVVLNAIGECTRALASAVPARA